MDEKEAKSRAQPHSRPIRRHRPDRPFFGLEPPEFAQNFCLVCARGGRTRWIIIKPSKVRRRIFVLIYFGGGCAAGGRRLRATLCDTLADNYDDKLPRRQCVFCVCFHPDYDAKRHRSSGFCVFRAAALGLGVGSAHHIWSRRRNLSLM
jgi:hypothetical protein